MHGRNTLPEPNHLTYRRVQTRCEQCGFTPNWPPVGEDWNPAHQELIEHGNFVRICPVTGGYTDQIPIPTQKWS